MNDSPQIIDLAKRFAVSPETRHVLACMKAAPDIELALSAVVPTLGRVEQRILITVVAFRMMGANLPAELTLIEHMPPMRGLSTSEIQDAFDGLVSGGTLMLAGGDGEEDMQSFYWPALERLVNDAVRNYEAPALVGLDGSRLR